MKFRVLGLLEVKSQTYMYGYESVRSLGSKDQRIWSVDFGVARTKSTGCDELLD